MNFISFQNNATDKTNIQKLKSVLVVNKFKMLN